MPAFSASAPAKIILFGEHAVVYHRPAIAVPVNQVQAKATVMADVQGPAGQVIIEAPDIQLKSTLTNLPDDHPLGVLMHLLLDELHAKSFPAFNLKIKSSIPLAAGMGSGAAVSVAILRAVSGFLGHTMSNEKVSELTFQVEKRYHGTPSGIDNTVITYSLPIYFIKEQPVEFLSIPQPVTLVIGDSGQSSITAEVVGEVRRKWETKPNLYEQYFDAIMEITNQGRLALESGQVEALGPLMVENHRVLQEIGVSNDLLDYLVTTAMHAGAWGAKLSGAGKGGNMMALADETHSVQVAEALRKAGAVNTIITTIHPFRS